MIKVSYRFPKGVDAEKQANLIAKSQILGSWGEPFVNRGHQFDAYMGTVLEASPTTTGAIATIGFPVSNTEGDIPSLLSMILGKFSFTGKTRVTQVSLPEGYGTPAKYGLAGIRERLNVTGRPLFMGIFKPALGLSADALAELLEPVAFAGLDLIKDDETMGNVASAPTLDRVKACKKVIDAAAQKNGRELLYAVNLTGPTSTLNQQAKRLIGAGANALLLNVLSYGYGCLAALAADPDITVPIFVQPSLAGALCGSSDGSSAHGLDYSVALGTLMRYAGADAVIYPAHYGAQAFNAKEEQRIREELVQPVRGCPEAMPVPSGGIHPGVLGRTYYDYGNDVILNAGSSIFDHPEGEAAGVEAFHQAWEAISTGTVLSTSTVPTGPLHTALIKWGVG